MNILVTHIFFILTTTWSLAYGCGQQRNRRDKKCRQIDDNFDGHGDAAVRCGAHRPMNHIRGFTRSQCMPPLGEYLRHIAPKAAMVNEFVETTQNTNKTQLLASNYGTFRALVVCENFIPKADPLLRSSMRQASYKCEAPQLELKSSRSFLALKRCQQTKSKKVFNRNMTIRVRAGTKNSRHVGFLL